MLGGNLDGPVVAALLGELSVDVSRHPGARNPCEPHEPYRELTLTWAGIEPGVGSAGERMSIPFTRGDSPATSGTGTPFRVVLPGT